MDRRTSSPTPAALALSVLLLSAALVSRPARAAQQAPATPAAPPASPAAPSAPVPAAPSSAMIEKIVTDALQSANDAQAEAGKIYKQAFILSGNGLGELSDKRLDVDLKNAGLHDALKRVLDDAKVAYTIDDDVSNDPKVTLKVSNATLPTVLDLLTEANGIGWRSEVTTSARAAQTIPPPPSGDTKGETLRAKPAASTGEVSVRVHVGKSIAGMPRSFRLGVMDLKGLPGGKMSLPAPLAAQAPFIRHFTWQERRATFTCPNCHNTITIVRTPEDVRCPKCGRVFEDDWKVCPYDGTKRPARKDEWHYCPICGKPIKLEEQQTSWTVTPFFPRFYVRVASSPDMPGFVFTSGGSLIPCPEEDEGDEQPSESGAIPPSPSLPLRAVL